MHIVMILFFILLAAVTFPIWFPLVMIFFVSFYMGMAWLVGMKITIKYKDKTVGYLRWFTYHRV